MKKMAWIKAEIMEDRTGDVSFHGDVDDLCIVAKLLTVNLMQVLSGAERRWLAKELAAKVLLPVLDGEDEGECQDD